MVRLLLVRHFPTAENHAGRFLGRRDLPALVPDGVAPLDLGRPPVVFTSPLARARTTAAALFPDVPARVDARLIERSFGAWEGCTRGQVAALQPDAVGEGGVLDLNRTPRGGESVEALCARVGAFLAEVAASEGSPAVAVAHAGVILAALALVRAPGAPVDWRRSVPYATPLTLEVPAGWRPPGAR